jgi:purine-cytosine permease-like protein
MNTRSLWSRVLIIIGGIAMLAGVIDPFEGAVVIVVGGALVLAGMLLGHTQRALLFYWTAVLVLIAAGWGVMVVLSNIGGVGGSTGRSLWWALLVAPYPVGWLMGIANLAVLLVRSLRRRNVS